MSSVVVLAGGTGGAKLARGMLDVVGADLVVVAPATADLGLAAVGLAPGRSVPVDDTMQVQGVDGRWLYAAGDVNGRVLLTHQGKYQGRAVGSLIAARASGAAEDIAAWGRHVATADTAAVPPATRRSPPSA